MVSLQKNIGLVILSANVSDAEATPQIKSEGARLAVLDAGWKS